MNEGNMFAFLMAGHETTAHSLAFALPLLALYPDEQEALYEHVSSIIGRGVDVVRHLPDC